MIPEWTMPNSTRIPKRQLECTNNNWIFLFCSGTSPNIIDIFQDHGIDPTWFVIPITKHGSIDSNATLKIRDGAITVALSMSNNAAAPPKVPQKVWSAASKAMEARSLGMIVDDKDPEEEPSRALHRKAGQFLRRKRERDALNSDVQIHHKKTRSDHPWNTPAS